MRAGRSSPTRRTRLARRRLSTTRRRGARCGGRCCLRWCWGVRRCGRGTSASMTRRCWLTWRWRWRRRAWRWGSRRCFGRGRSTWRGRPVSRRRCWRGWMRRRGVVMRPQDGTRVLSGPCSDSAPMAGHASSPNCGSLAAPFTPTRATSGSSNSQRTTTRSR